jgi:predicted DNA-binding transcriptional regulator AlpA
MAQLSAREVERRARQRAAALSEKDAAHYLGMSESWLRHQRLSEALGRPPHLRIGRAVRYRVCDLDDFLEARLAGAA